MAKARFNNSHLSETNRSADMQANYALKEKSEQIHYLCWKRETEAARTLAKCLLTALPGALDFDKDMQLRLQICSAHECLQVAVKASPKAAVQRGEILLMAFNALMETAERRQLPFPTLERVTKVEWNTRLFCVLAYIRGCMSSPDHPESLNMSKFRLQDYMNAREKLLRSIDTSGYSKEDSDALWQLCESCNITDHAGNVDHKKILAVFQNHPLDSFEELFSNLLFDCEAVWLRKPTLASPLETPLDPIGSLDSRLQDTEQRLKRQPQGEDEDLDDPIARSKSRELEHVAPAKLKRQAASGGGSSIESAMKATDKLRRIGAPRYPLTAFPGATEIGNEAAETTALKVSSSTRQLVNARNQEISDKKDDGAFMDATETERIDSSDGKKGSEREKFTPDEELELRKGVEKYGPSKWALILKEYDFSCKRTSVDLKDKWRNMKKKDPMLRAIEIHHGPPNKKPKKRLFSRIKGSEPSP